MLPSNADLTSYGWCDALGCQDKVRLTSPAPAAVYGSITAIETTGA
jgi:hypothetical protein